MRWFFCLLALIIVVAQSQPSVASVTIDAHKKQREPASADKTSAHDQRGARGQPLFVQISDAEKPLERFEQERSDKAGHAANEGRLVFWTVILSVATWLLALIAGGQLWMFRRQLRLMKVGADDAKTLANAAIESAKAAENNTRTTQVLERAYVYGGPGFNLVNKESGQIIGKIITIGNYGKTPAYVEKVRWGICPFGEWKGQEPENVDVLRDVLYPMTPPKPRISVPFPDGGDAFAFFGRIYFRDIFGEYWYSTFEHRIEPNGGWTSYSLDHNAELHQCTQSDLI